MTDGMKSGIVGAVVGAILTGAVSIGLFIAEKDSIEKKTVETLAGYFDSVDKDMSYDQVLKFIYEESKKKDNEISVLKQNKENLQSQVDSLNEKVSVDETNKSTIASIRSLANSNEYAKALAILNSVADKTPEMQVLFDEYSKKYEAQVIAQADTIINKEKYDEAINLIDEALKVLPNSSILIQKKENIILSKPKMLINVLKPYETKEYSEKGAGQSMSMGGTKYYNGFQLEGWSASHAIFNLNSQYTQITGIVGHIDGSYKSDETLRIFADGVLIYTIEVGYQNLPQDFSIDVKDVKQLKFECSSGGAQIGLAELVIK